MTLTPQDFLVYELKSSYEEIIKYANVDTTGFLRFLHEVAEEKSLNEFKSKKKISRLMQGLEIEIKNGMAKIISSRISCGYKIMRKEEL
jgi:hypothetical protein